MKKLDLRWVKGGTERHAKETGRTHALEFHSLDNERSVPTDRVVLIEHTDRALRGRRTRDSVTLDACLMAELSLTEA